MSSEWLRVFGQETGTYLGFFFRKVVLGQNQDMSSSKGPWHYEAGLSEVISKKKN
jgi:hypothetical protein